MAAVVVCLVSVRGTAASLPPGFRFQTLQAGRIKVHFHAQVEKPARRTMALIQQILPRLEDRYRVHVPTLDVVVHDANDSPNGLATSFPYPYVEIRTASPDGADSGPTESWLRTVVTHELTHIVHIEQAGGIYGFGRRIFGRAPFLFPNALQPTWFIEGLAVREETRWTAFGRGRHSFTKMVVDEAARSGQLEKMDQATLGLDLWPFGNSAYLFGEEFLSSIEKKYGEDVTRDLAISHGASFRPYLDDRTFRKTTGQGLSLLWREFAQERTDRLRSKAAPTLLTHRGVVQTSPRLSPDGSLIAYTSRSLDHRGEIRLMNKDGSSDRRLTFRLSGTALSWARDGRSIVFDETNQVRKFESRSDLFQVDLATLKRRRLSHGLRASDPDCGPPQSGSPSPIVFVQRFADRSELSVLPHPTASRPLTTSPPGTEWSRPRFSPKGDLIVASRLLDGFSDLVTVDSRSGVVTPLTGDRAVDAEPAWVDDDTLVFRSDREDGSFRLYLINRDGSALRSVLDSPENAFVPEVDLREGTVFYAHYSAHGYDLASAPFVEGGLRAAYEDPLPENVQEPAPFSGPARDYSPLSSLRPRFVSPYAEFVSEEWRVGLLTLSFDPLLRTTYGVAGSWGTKVSGPNVLGYLRYDRFTPSLTVFGRAESSPLSAGKTDLVEGRLSVDYPLERSALRSQTLGLTMRRRREESTRQNLDTAVVAVGWQFDSTKTYPLSISPQDGFRLRIAATREVKALGSDLDFGKVIVDARAYARVGRTVLVSRAGGGWTFGNRKPLSAFGVGGLASQALLDPVGDQPAVLRGYESPGSGDPSHYGTRLAFGNLDWRVPLAHPQRGIRALPFFLKHLHLTVSLDAAVVSANSLRLKSARVASSLGLGADIYLGHRIPLTIQGGVGRGLTKDGKTIPWFSIGFPF